MFANLMFVKKISNFKNRKKLDPRETSYLEQIGNIYVDMKIRISVYNSSAVQAYLSKIYGEKKN